MAFFPNVPLKTFGKELYQDISDDNVFNGAAALAYYLMLAIFPAMLAMLAVIPYLPIAHLDQSIMNLLRESLPGNAATMFTGVIEELTKNQKGGLLSFGLLFTLYSASNGSYAIMQQLNITYDVKEGRPFWKSRAHALLLTLLNGALIVSAFALIAFGGTLQNFVDAHIASGPVVSGLFVALRWAIVVTALVTAFALTYYIGPDVEQKFRFISPGAVMGAATIILASLGFKIYVTHFGKYEATYGSIGGVIVMMLWLYVGGLVMLIGSEINALVEHYSPEGKSKGEKKEPLETAAPRAA